ncbi:hypothetical protein [Staphylococcus intermedius]|uniref:Uncharacterized protein n=1 Tax=Staphylococcus intermedius NCTC 11048 TaxID=1141106 RepID=A0A380G6N2_STAIN|nr:hypothetical protein [Staphylococcus intermedius]PCF64943.1 hypothetical protein B5C04_02530 [Staphylococcus intermedius]PCF80554.1 hypothetical protein B4W74_02550 [Staphylococcus intermedius]PCF81903.1 hypothetical protein B4W70_02530 [Staphylococcus intermedius]PCF88239.1 hypothetical protein B4W75_05575 [Staphylococcus intermedius]PCF88954.1 hypothetical protein B4W76_01570 [Staphylococcus intermedius]
MKKELDYEKLDKMRAETLKASMQTKDPDVEDMPLEPIEPPEGFFELTDEEFIYVAFGIKPE